MTSTTIAGQNISDTIREVLKYRPLVLALTERHLAARYRGSLLGFLWSILNPLCLMLVYVLVFHYYMRTPTEVNYPVFLFCGLLPWIWTSSALVEGTSSVVSSGHLITKSLFPAQILPIISVITTLVNFILSLPLLFIFMLFVGQPLTPALCFLPALIILHFLFLTGLTIGLSALNVFFRDVQHVLQNFLTFLFFLCPVVYPETVVPQRFRFLLDLNPFALLTQCYHEVVLQGVAPGLWQIFYLVAWVGVALLVGNALFMRYREGFAEML